jgi:hypothetical protein
MVLVLDAVSSSTSTSTANAEYEYEYEYEYEKPWDYGDWGSEILDSATSRRA